MTTEKVLVCLIVVASAAATNNATQAGKVEDMANAEGKKVELDIQPEGPHWGILSCLPPAFQSAGWNWSREFLFAYTGQAFAFSVMEDGKSVWPKEMYERSYFFRMLEFLGDDFEMISASLGEDNPSEGGLNPVSSEEHTRDRESAWGAVREALDAGVAPVVWQAMSLEMKQSSNQPLPFMWSLIVGYDKAAQTYTVHHPGAGRYSIQWDAFGYSDHAQWFCVMIIKPQSKPFDALPAHRTVIKRAIESSRGMRPANTEEATAHGLAAWEMWLDAFRQGTVTNLFYTGYLAISRASAAVYLSEIESHFPEGARVHLGEAAEYYRKVVAAIEELNALQLGSGVESRDTSKLRWMDDPAHWADGDEITFDLNEGAEILSRALEHERAAVASLQEVLNATD
jgi:hypothetical protein